MLWVNSDTAEGCLWQKSAGGGVGIHHRWSDNRASFRMLIALG